MKHRITSENITSLKEGEILVFGSNQSGKHGKFAAKQALGFSAVWGQAAGLQGRAYGIPTKNASITKTLPIDQIRPYVDDFIAVAKANSHLTFLVTQVGCGAAGYSPKDIAPLFQEAFGVENIHLPKSFWRIITVRHLKKQIKDA